MKTSVSHRKSAATTQRTAGSGSRATTRSTAGIAEAKQRR